MAIVQNPLIGRARKQAGGVVFTKIYDKNVIRSKPQAVSTSPSFNQQLNRDYFKLVTRLVAQLTNEELEIMYPEKPKKGTRKQLLTRTLLKNKKKENGRYVPNLLTVDNLGIIDPYHNPTIELINFKFLHYIQPSNTKPIQNELNNEYFSYLIFDDVNNSLKIIVDLQGKTQENFYYYLRYSNDLSKVFNIRRFLTNIKLSEEYLFKTALNNTLAALISDLANFSEETYPIHENSAELNFENFKRLLNVNFKFYSNNETPFLNIHEFNQPISFYNNIDVDHEFVFYLEPERIKIEATIPEALGTGTLEYAWNVLVTNISTQESIFISTLIGEHFEPYPQGWVDSDGYYVFALYKILLNTDPLSYNWGYIKIEI